MQCPCGGDSKPTHNDRPWRVCERCGRAINKREYHVLFDLPPLSAEEYVAMKPKILEARQNSRWTVVHESAIIEAIRNGEL